MTIEEKKLQSTEKSVLLKRYESDRKSAVSFFIGGIFLLLFGIAALCFYNGAEADSYWLGAYIKVFGEVISMDKEIVVILKVAAMLTFVIGILDGVITFLRIIAISKMHMEIYSDKIVGAGAPSYTLLQGIVVKEFVLRYEDILSIDCNRKLIVIKATSQTYSVLLANKKEAYNELRKNVLHEDTSNSDSATEKSQERRKPNRIFLRIVVIALLVEIIVGTVLFFAVRNKSKPVYGDGKCDKCGKTATEDLSLTEMCDDCHGEFFGKIFAQYKKTNPW